ncbi:F-actin-capping protein subunit alpha [Tulasnella sp. 403]|nr:F-actin-capping protein subunit alpha [Tulasnella sp. 403]
MQGGISRDEAMSIASGFLLQSPPGEINDVLGDIRNIIADDAELESGISGALEEYNLTQFTTVDVPNQNHKVIICEEGRVGDIDGPQQRFLDPKSRTTFLFNHADLTVSGSEEADVNQEGEKFREALESNADIYIRDHFNDGVVSVFSDPSSPSKFTVVTVTNKYNPGNFWSGRWRSKYAIDLEKGVVSGKVLINVHYYEQGNVQLQTTHTPSLSLPAPHPTPANAQTAAKLLKLIANQEGEYQTSLAAVYHRMGEKTFKGLRRALPMTRSKMDWDRVLGYKLGAELSAGSAGRFTAGSS